jgi:hypothetical protein
MDSVAGSQSGTQFGEQGFFRRGAQDSKHGDLSFPLLRFDNEVHGLYGVLSLGLFKKRYLAADDLTIADMICYTHGKHCVNGEHPGWKFYTGDLKLLRQVVRKGSYIHLRTATGNSTDDGEIRAALGLIGNARLAEDLSLDRQGSVRVYHETAVQEFYDRAEVERVYYPEIELLLKEGTGAEKVVVCDHQVRNTQLFRRGEKQARDHASSVHNDYTAKSGPRRVRDHLAGEEAEERLQHRFAEINVWRPIRGPVESWPLALCDALSIHSKDFVPADLVYRDKVGEVYRFTYSPKHRWFIFRHSSATRPFC